MVVPQGTELLAEPVRLSGRSWPTDEGRAVALKIVHGSGDEASSSKKSEPSWKIFFDSATASPSVQTVSSVNTCVAGLTTGVSHEQDRQRGSEEGC